MTTPDQIARALKPCPLCRSANIETDRDGPEFPVMVVWCKDCGCSVDDHSHCARIDELPWDRWQNRSEVLKPSEAWQELVEYDDRTSPEEYPDMALITADELARFMERAPLTQPTDPNDGREAQPAGWLYTKVIGQRTCTHVTRHSADYPDSEGWTETPLYASPPPEAQPGAVREDDEGFDDRGFWLGESIAAIEAMEDEMYANEATPAPIERTEAEAREVLAEKLENAGLRGSASSVSGGATTCAVHIGPVIQAMLAFASTRPAADTEQAFMKLCEALDIPATAAAYLEVPRILSARPAAAVEREAIARIIDPDAWHETLPTDGCGAYWIGRRNAAKTKADAILALSPHPGKDSGEQDSGRFAEYSSESLAAQCRMQARDNLDPEYSQFMRAVADRIAPLAATPAPIEPSEAEARSCTCHPDDRPAGPCKQRYANSECVEAEAQEVLDDLIDLEELAEHASEPLSERLLSVIDRIRTMPTLAFASTRPAAAVDDSTYQVVGKRMLNLASYCGGEGDCTDERPCNDCLAMDNVALVTGEIRVLGGLDYCAELAAKGGA